MAVGAELAAHYVVPDAREMDIQRRRAGQLVGNVQDVGVVWQRLLIIVGSRGAVGATASKIVKSPSATNRPDRASAMLASSESAVTGSTADTVRGPVIANIASELDDVVIWYS